MIRHRIERLASPEDMSRWGYRGWIISREIRTWDARGYGGNGWAGPKITWNAKKRFALGPGTPGFRTRRDAIAYIDHQEDNRE
jgi:hypothetical protein